MIIKNARFAVENLASPSIAKAKPNFFLEEGERVSLRAEEILEPRFLLFKVAAAQDRDFVAV